MGRTVESRPTLSFLQHWLQALLVAIVVIVVACVLVQIALPAVTTFVARHLLLLITIGVIVLLGGTSPWTVPALWRARRAYRLDKQNAAYHKAHMKILDAIPQQIIAGYNVEIVNGYSNDKIRIDNPFVHGRVAATVEEIKESQIELPAPALPTNVRYEDVRGQVPVGHVLVGIGRSGIETRDAAVGACVWVCGLSGTGKTSTTVTRVEERRAIGHGFLGCDPHWFKPDSLTNAVKAYEGSFLMPMAKTPEEMKVVLIAFLEEFRGRKSGTIPQPWRPVTLIVDEVGSLMDTTTEEEEEIAKMLPSIARICGQEARNFNMGGIFISQQATGLSWLRKVSLMVIVHQLLMESEKRLALNGDKEAIESMKSWPVGRTYVYGVGFQDGPRTVQQPYFAKVVDADPPRMPQQSKPLAGIPIKSRDNADTDTTESFFQENRRSTDSLRNRSEMLANAVESTVPAFKDAVPNTDPTLEILGPDDKQFTDDQAAEFLRRYRKNPIAIKDILRQMNAGEGLSNRYSKHASFLVKEAGEVK